MTQNTRLLATTKVVALLLAPVLLAGGSHELLATVWPGHVQVSTWRATTTFGTIVFGAMIAVMLWRSKVAALGKAVLSLFVLGFFGVIAVSLNMQSTCAPSRTHIGEVPRQVQVASCK